MRATIFDTFDRDEAAWIIALYVHDLPDWSDTVADHYTRAMRLADDLRIRAEVAHHLVGLSSPMLDYVPTFATEQQAADYADEYHADDDVTVAYVADPTGDDSHWIIEASG